MVLIPQAFTTRDMSEAYRWAQALPPDVRDGIKSMEQMVWLYLRAKRLGGGIPTKDDLAAYAATAQPENSKSSLDFQKTLKSLRPQLDQFDFENQGNGIPTGVASFTPPATPTRQLELEPHAVSATAMPAALTPPPPISHASSSQSVAHASPPNTYAPMNSAPQAGPAAAQTPAPSSGANLLAALRLDPRSRQIVTELREGLNLSCDTEVIRMSLVLAHKHLKDLLK